ncbi:cupin domain-containing protein [Prolixibacteraceae bacterium]|nr:cupin domain-containing protein [Prolixibacteraceae bacterium]
MGNTKKVTTGKHYQVINVGKTEEIKNHTLIHPKLGIEIKGKIFLNQDIELTGSEISFSSIPPKSELPYFHVHNKDEEVYIIQSGTGYFQVDDETFPIEEGSVIRVAPAGERTLYNTSDVEMVYICIQTKEKSLEKFSSEDGKRVDRKSKFLSLL